MSKIINLTKNMIAIVDEEDYEWLNQYKWCVAKGSDNKCYAVRRNKNLKPNKIRMHREIMNLQHDNNLEVDHINGDTLDNRKSNLRICIHKDNLRNRKIQSNNTSGFNGVSFTKRENKWRSYIVIDQKQKSLGSFDSKEEAAKAYNEAAKKYFGEFAKLNIVEKEK